MTARKCQPEATHAGPVCTPVPGRCRLPSAFVLCTLRACACSNVIHSMHKWSRSRPASFSAHFSHVQSRAAAAACRWAQQAPTAVPAVQGRLPRAGPQGCAMCAQGREIPGSWAWAALQARGPPQTAAQGLGGAQAGPLLPTPPKPPHKFPGRRRRLWRLLTRSGSSR